MVLKGIKEKSLTAPHTRFPITVDIMAKIRETLKLRPAERDSTMMWAAGASACFGFLRYSEFTVPSQDEYCLDTLLSLQDVHVSIDSRTSSTMIQNHLKLTRFELVASCVWGKLVQTRVSSSGGGGGGGGGGTGEASPP